MNFGGKISGVIYTGYKEKYSDLIEKYTDFNEDESELTRSEFEEEFRADLRYVELVDDIKIDLGISYTLDMNYVDNYSLSDLTMVRTTDLYVSAGGPEILASSLTYASNIERNKNVEYADGEIGLPYELYNTLFGTSYTKDDMFASDERFGQQIVFTRYVDNSPKKGVVYSKTFTVKCLTNAKLEMSDGDMKSLKKSDWQPSRIYFLDPTNVDSVINYVIENEYELVSVEQSKLVRINELISTFHDLFGFMQTLIISLIAFYLTGYGFKSIRSNAYQIGVIKALGGGNKDVRKIFVSKTLIVGVIISILSVVASIFFVDIADGILVASIEKVSKTHLYDLRIIKAIPTLLFVDVLILLGVALMSSLLTALVLRLIKPVEIIKAKE